MLGEIVMVFLALATAVHTVRSWRSYAGLARVIRTSLLVVSGILVLVVLYRWVAPVSATGGTVIFRTWLCLGALSYGEDLLQHLRNLRAIAAEDKSRTLVEMAFDSAALLACLYVWFLP